MSTLPIVRSSMMEEYKMNEELLVNSPIDASEFEHIGQDLGS